MDPAIISSKNESKQSAQTFPIIGVGASAGGLKAFEQFLGAVPENSGCAFVMIQHLDPTHIGHMPELLQRATPMKVAQVEDGMKIQPNRVYVIPPNHELSVLHGVFYLLEPIAPRGLRLPIDYFFSALALDQQARSIGVVLSGMGSDGTMGLRAIKEKGGLTVAQDPDSAEFDSMPRSTLLAGFADMVAPVEELPAKIMGYLKRAPVHLPMPLVLDEKSQSAMRKIVILLRTHTGNDFSFYKLNTLHRRIERRMGLHQITRMAAYVSYLEQNSQELSLLFKELLIGVTNFFRDTITWEELRHHAIPQLLATRAAGQAIRAWVPGCSTGEEAYSLAILMKEAIEEMEPKKSFTVQIFATDLDEDAINKARAGLYPGTIQNDVSEDRLKRFFHAEEEGYRVSKEIREMVIFAPQNLIMDPPFTKLDLLSCRNLLIYLTAEVQKKLIPLFHYSLREGGLLVQGSAETIGEYTDLFCQFSPKSRIFHRTESRLRSELISFPSSFSGPRASLPAIAPNPKPPVSLQSLADQLILQVYAPPAVLTSDKGDILYVSGRTGKYLEPAAGKANWNLFVMVRDELRLELTAAFQKALRQKECVSISGLKIGPTDNGHFVDIAVQRIETAGPLNGMVMIVFKDVPLTIPAASTRRQPSATAMNARVTELEQELQKLQCEARATHEEMQTSQEELRSSNEELQSTNEELTTSKEEMQSLNEELQTVNAELQAKLEELSHTSSDMKNLLDSTDIATLFLDRDLNIRRFTPQVTKIIKLIPTDTGRPITDIVSEFNDPTLADDVHEVLTTLTPLEKSYAARDGSWFTVRIMAYRTLEDQTDGVVITFTNITVAKNLEAELRLKQSVLEQHVQDQSIILKRMKQGDEATSP
jgi:chemotaxis methyl-accepting protein methylase